MDTSRCCSYWRALLEISREFVIQCEQSKCCWCWCCAGICWRWNVSSPQLLTTSHFVCPLPSKAMREHQNRFIVFTLKIPKKSVCENAKIREQMYCKVILRGFKIEKRFYFIGFKNSLLKWLVLTFEFAIKTCEKWTLASYKSFHEENVK